MKQISIFDMLKVGIGPSSSHTMGPWKAALRFLKKLDEKETLSSVATVHVDLYGSLALTGKGHGTDKAVVLGLSGYQPEDISSETLENTFKLCKEKCTLLLAGKKSLHFDLERQIDFHFKESLSFHPNGMRIKAFDENGQLLSDETYFSIGGGFVIKEGEEVITSESNLPYPIETAEDIKKHCSSTGKGIAWVVIENEKVWRKNDQVHNDVLNIWGVMLDGVYRGCNTEGILPGGLEVNRRASLLHRNLLDTDISFDSTKDWLAYLKGLSCDFEKTLKFVSCFAIATNEENASFGKVVTAPTNGAAGVIPAVLMYYICFSSQKGVTDEDVVNFLVVAGEIGSIFKKRATISAAKGGCQAEIGVSSSMAAAALTAGFGGSVEQCLMAAEIAMEHHLGLTCDPVNGLVQVPCIERNSMGAIKAITASQIALESDPNQAKVSLDAVIKTMWDTANDMNEKYKETSLGGLAVNIAVSVSEC